MSVPRFVLVGHPVRHSLSPAIHRAAYAALGVSARYELEDCPEPADVARLVAALRRGEVAGLNVTLPHKQRVLELADAIDPVVRETCAANVLALVRDRVEAHNTDVLGLADELSRLRPGASSALVLGAGGAALAAVAACRRRGIARIAVVARRFRAGAPPATWPNAERLAALGAELLAWPAGDSCCGLLLADVAARSDLVIQATSAGMRGGAAGEAVSEIVPWERVPTSALAYDVVYTPAVTPFLDAAQRRGLEAVGGLGMLVAQAGHALTLWLGVTPPLEQMRAAAVRALAEREAGA